MKLLTSVVNQKNDHTSNEYDIISKHVNSYSMVEHVVDENSLILQLYVFYDAS